MTEKLFYNRMMGREPKPAARSEFEELFLRLRPQLLIHAFRVLRNREDAEDVVQQAFAAGWKCWLEDASPITSNPKAFLFAVTRSRAIDHLRARDSHRRRVVSAAAATYANETDPLTKLDADEQVTSVYEAAEHALKPDERALLWEAFALGRTVREIATERGVSASTVHHRAWAALDKLRKALKKPQK